MPPIDKNRLAHTIRSLEGLTTEDKSALLELLSTRKKYGLVWEDKSEAVEEELRTKLPVLTEVVERRIVGTSEKLPNHILIEGDNLHALTALQYTHAGKVDVVFLDPPYNTGNKDFIYNDHLVDKEDQWRHSKWLSFMSRRLRMAKSLLRDSGAIFITIDDNEVHNLRHIMDEVFGEENFVAMAVWQKAYTSNMTAEFISNTHDYVAIYCKSRGMLQFGKTPRTNEQKEKFKNPDGDSRGPWKAENLSAGKFYSAGQFTITGPNGDKFTPPSGRFWRCNEEQYEKWLADGRITFGIGGKGRPMLKKFIKEMEDGLTPNTWWRHEEFGTNKQASIDLKSVFQGESFFDTPKPVELLKRILQMGGPKESLVLDFFAGSGTTLHATIALNADDGGSRKCILVTNNENNICERVTYERIKRVIAGQKNTSGDSVGDFAANNVRYFRTDFVDRQPTLQNRIALTTAAEGMLCIKENCYAGRADLSRETLRVFEGEDALLLLVLEPEIIPEVVELIGGQTKHCKVYVFSPGAYAWDEEFVEVAHKVTLCALPEAILQAYRRVLPPAGPSLVYEETDEEGSE